MSKREGCFRYNGVVYYTGTIIQIYNTDRFGREIIEEATFVCRIIDSDQYIIQLGQRTCYYPKNIFDKMIAGVTNKTNLQAVQHFMQEPDVKNRSATIEEELNIDGVLIAWIWYIFIMLIATLFYDRIGIWIFASLVFFGYRNRKLREAGYKK